MPLQWVYEDIANPGPGDSALDITDRVRLYTVDITQNAEEGAVALSSVTIDDPHGDLDIVGYRKLVAYETDASIGSNALTYNGFITDRKITRGPYRTSLGRHWVCSVADTNCLLEFRLMVGSDANRPAETDAERVTWLLSTNEMSRIPNHTFVNLTGPVAMDAVDYRGQRGVDILNDCAQASGKNYFAFCIDAPGPVLPSAPGATHLWYDFADSTERSSIIRLSNDLDDVGGLTFAIADDTELERDPSRVYSGALVNYDGGTAYEEDFTISAEFTRRDAIVPASNVKTNAKATARALRYLDEMSTEEDRIRTAVRLPNAMVNFVQYGMRVQFKATHLPGYEDFVWLRVLRSTILDDSEETYLVTLELGTGPSVVEPVVPVGEGALYIGQDNNFYGVEDPSAVGIYVNGVFMGFEANHDADDYDDVISIPDGLLVAGDNVIAVGIENGISPGSWAGGNATGLVLRVYLGTDDSGPIQAYTSTTTTKVWDVENLNLGTLGGEPGGWQEAAFDDSGWDDAADVGAPPFSGLDGFDDIYPPTSPSEWIASPATLTAAQSGSVLNTYPAGLIWLARIHFTIA